MLSRRTYKVYGIVLALIFLYTAAGVFFAAVCWPGALDEGAAEPRTVDMRARQYPLLTADQ